jgi:hypothetical protein
MTRNYSTEQSASASPNRQNNSARHSRKNKTILDNIVKREGVSKAFFDSQRKYHVEENKALSSKINKAVTLSLTNVIKAGLSDLLPNPLEVEVLRADRKLQAQVAHRAKQIIGRGCFTPEDFLQFELIEVPKRKYGDRPVCAVIDPLDSIAYLALAILAEPSIERHRKPAREQTVFSYRFAPRMGKLFDSRYCYGSFMEAVESRLKNHGIYCQMRCEEVLPRYHTGTCRYSIAKLPRDTVCL